MSIQHREDSIRDMKLERLGVTPPQDWNDVEQVRTAKKAEIGLACSAAIYAGIDVGGAHYSLTEHDQTELMAQFQTVKEGAEEVPYHADGELCRMYTAEEFTALTQAQAMAKMASTKLNAEASVSAREKKAKAAEAKKSRPATTYSTR